MNKQKRVFRTERIWLKSSTELKYLCHLAKNLFNEAYYLVRQEYFDKTRWIQTKELRNSRGLFKSKKGIIIYADVNGGYNILKKAFLNAFTADRIEDVGLHPTRWRLGAATS